MNLSAMSKKPTKKNAKKYSDSDCNENTSKDLFKEKLKEANEFLKRNPIPKELLKK